MKQFGLLIFVFLSINLFSQRKVEPTSSVIVKGTVKTEFVITEEKIKAANQLDIPDIVITNHKGEIKDTAKDLRGVLLIDLLKELDIPINKPKELSEYYFNFIASDGYKVVFSWNELFNSPTGKAIFIVTSKNGKVLSEMDDKILLLCTSDIQSGRRHVKGLKEIVVHHAD